MLTGKAKDDFEKYAKEFHDFVSENQKGKRLFYIESIDDYKMINTEHYIENVGTSMFFALVIEWFDSVGLYIEANIHDNKKFWCDVSFFEDDNKLSNDSSLKLDGEILYFDSRSIAIKQGIIKANEIYNTTP